MDIAKRPDLLNVGCLCKCRQTFKNIVLTDWSWILSIRDRWNNQWGQWIHHAVGFLRRTKKSMQCQVTEILKVYRIHMYRILRVGTHLTHTCSLLSLLFILILHYQNNTSISSSYLFMPGTLIGLWHLEFKPLLLLRSYYKNASSGRVANFTWCKQAFQEPPRTS